jgi:hypothetical protein
MLLWPLTPALYRFRTARYATRGVRAHTPWARPLLNTSIFDVGFGVGLSENASATVSHCVINITASETMLVGAFFVHGYKFLQVRSVGTFNSQCTRTLAFEKTSMSSRQKPCWSARSLSKARISQTKKTLCI